MAQLTKEEIVTLQTLKLKGQSGRSIARQLNVTEGTVRYHLRRQTSGAVDGRRKQSLIEKQLLVEVVRHWWDAQLESLPAGRAPNVHKLWQFLLSDYDYGGSYKSVAIDDLRTYQGLVYRCRQAHTTQVGWHPPAVPALWEPA